MSNFVYQEWSRAFEIFSNHCPDGGYVSAEHDVVRVDLAPEYVPAEAQLELEELGWHIDEDLNCFYTFC